MKVKRAIVYDKYGDVFAGLYEQPHTSDKEHAGHA